MIEAPSSRASDLQNASPNLSSNVSNVTDLTAPKPQKTERNMNATAATKSVTSHSTAASSQRRPNSPIIPRNPRDTVSSSPGRRKKIIVRGAAMADASLDGQSLPSMGGNSAQSRHTHHTQHTHHTDHSSVRIKQTLPLGQERSPSVSHLSSMNYDAIVIRSDPDDQEQAMFEQRLCEDEFGVAVRKINQNGKSVLRYVRCVPLFPLQSLHSDALPLSTNASANSAQHRNLRSDETATHSQNGARSVSSLMGRISRRGLVSSAEKKIRNRSRSRERRNTDASIGSSINTSNMDNDITNPLAATNSAQKSQRALTWGKKNEVRIPLTRFTAVRKGKTTDRTRRNPCPSNRLLSLVTDDRNHSSLDIEAPTQLDRDKFARAFARFLNVNLETEVDYVHTGNSKIGGSVASSVATSAIASDTGTSFSLYCLFLFFFFWSSLLFI